MGAASGAGARGCWAPAGWVRCVLRLHRAVLCISGNKFRCLHWNLTCIWMLLFCFALLWVVTGFCLWSITLIFNIGGFGLVIYFSILKLHFQSKCVDQLSKTLCCIWCFLLLVSKDTGSSWNRGFSLLLLLNEASLGQFSFLIQVKHEWGSKLSVLFLIFCFLGCRALYHCFSPESFSCCRALLVVMCCSRVEEDGVARSYSSSSLQQCSCLHSFFAPCCVSLYK